MKIVSGRLIVVALLLALCGCVLIGQTIGERRIAELLIIETELLEQLARMEDELDGEPVDSSQDGIFRGERVYLRRKLQEVRDELRQLELHWDLDRRDLRLDR